ncbi:hypothetical protein [Vallitalea guaymasensis]|uniref:Uncharacterized protein n=1 Tax=Vallitalea guaymasensis TaxID=1185412 RepID=A0A8J8MCS5_9FIRM|nr:hypothetical protein [Vallitalea guaymasensis]QUH30587.1 hypothetical protein HYG85_17380 [Vallitalea guaymasensis]
MKDSKIKTLLLSTLLLTIIFTSSWSTYAEEINYEKVCSFQEVEHEWIGDYTGEYNRPRYLRYEAYDKMGKKISSSQVSSLSNVEKVARTILGEICNVPPRIDNAYAVAQAIKNRMDYDNKTAVQVISSGFDAYGGGAFKDPLNYYYLEDEYRLWAECAWLAACLVEGDSIPTSGYDDIGNSRFFGDISVSSYLKRFKLSNGTTCNETNIESATTFVCWGRKNPILNTVKKFGNHVYFEVNDR